MAKTRKQGARTATNAERELGVAALWLVVSLTMIAGMLAMVVDVGFGYFNRQRLQDSLDLAAIAAVQELHDEIGNQAEALAAVQRTLDFNYPDGGERLVAVASCEGAVTTGQVGVCFGRFEARDSKGKLLPTGQRFTAGGTQVDAVRLSGRAQSGIFFAGLFGIDAIDVAGVATAVRSGVPAAQLTISSTLLRTHRGLVNQVLGILGGNAGLNVLGANGIADAEVNFRDFLDVLGPSIGISAGSYEAVLAAPITVGDLLSASALAVGADTSAGADLDALNGSGGFSADVRGMTLQLSELVSAQTGMNSAGLDFAMNLFELVYSALLVANSNHAASGAITIDPASVDNFPFLNMGGSVADISVSFTIVEPPQLSAVGNPVVAAGLTTADQQDTAQGGIYVRTAQIRLHVRIEIPALTALSDLIADMQAMAEPIAPVLTSALGLNVVGTVQNLVDLLSGILFIGTRTETRDVLDIQLLTRSEDDDRPPGLDIVIDVGGASAYVTDYQCPDAGGEKGLDVQIASQAATVRVGRLVDPDAVFSSAAAPEMEPLPLIDIGTRNCTTTKTCVTGLLCSAPVTTCYDREAMTGGGIAIHMESEVLGTAYDPDHFDDPPDVGTGTSGTCYKGNAPPPPYCEHPRKNEKKIVASVKSTLSGLHFKAYAPDTPASLLKVAIAGTDGIISGTTTNLQPVLSTISGITDPLVAHLLNALAIGVANVDVGANLTCTTGGRLVR